MKVFVILESYTDYEGGNATSFGVFRTKESAIKNLPNAIIERFGYESVEDYEEGWEMPLMRITKPLTIVTNATNFLI